MKTRYTLACVDVTPHMQSSRNPVRVAFSTVVVCLGSTLWLGQRVGPGRQAEPPHISPPGIDLVDMASDIFQPQGEDVARISWHLHNLISKYQETFSVIEKVTLGG